MRETRQQGLVDHGRSSFMSYASETQTLENAGFNAGWSTYVVKLEGGAWISNTTKLLTERHTCVRPYGPNPSEC